MRFVRNLPLCLIEGLTLVEVTGTTSEPLTELMAPLLVYHYYTQSRQSFLIQTGMFLSNDNLRS